MIKLPQILRALVTSGGQTPYTFDWEPATTLVPVDVDTSTASVGPLNFGDHIDAARVFGKPDDYHRYEGLACGLFYYRRGFHLSFDEQRRFSFCSFSLSPDTPPPKEKIEYTPVVIKPRCVLTGQTPAAEVSALLGKPVDQSQDADGALFTFAINALAVDCHFNAEGRLVDVDVFPVENHQSSPAKGS